MGDEVGSKTEFLEPDMPYDRFRNYRLRQYHYWFWNPADVARSVACNLVTANTIFLLDGVQMYNVYTSDHQGFECRVQFQLRMFGDNPPTVFDNHGGGTMFDWFGGEHYTAGVLNDSKQIYYEKDFKIPHAMTDPFWITTECIGSGVSNMMLILNGRLCGTKFNEFGQLDHLTNWRQAVGQDDSP